jgi:hypothetical protein
VRFGGGVHVLVDLHRSRSMSTPFTRTPVAPASYEPSVPAGPLAATVLADALFRTTTGQPVPAELRGHPLPTIRAATAREGLEAIIRGPSAVTFA